MRAAHELCRLRAAFREWPTVAFKGLLWKHFDLPRRDLVFHSRAGTTIAAPLVRNVGALYTVLDVFAFDAYECDWELEQAPVVVDVGANIGAWVLRLAEKWPRVSGVCYEPDPAAAAYLARNLAMNGLAESVTVRPEAVSVRTGTASLFQAEPGDGTSSLRPVSHAMPFEREIGVRTLSFSDAIEQAGREVSLLKIDCEGAEYDIVDRSLPDAWERVKRVVVEYHPAPPEKLEALRSSFADLGYVIVKERRRSGCEGTLWLVRAAS